MTHEQNLARATAWMDAMQRAKSNYSAGVRGPAFAELDRERRYEELRERYANGSIDLEDFTAAVVALLREGL